MQASNLNLTAHAWSEVTPQAVAQKQRDPRYRKATRNMVFATVVWEELLAKSLVDSSQRALILGSSLGELGQTLDYLKSLAVQGVSRPLLFQNSLHSATAGYLSVFHAITGPCITISQGSWTTEACLISASMLLTSGVVKECLLIGIDLKPPVSQLSEKYLEGAAGLLVSLKPPTVGEKIISGFAPGSGHKDVTDDKHYDSDGFSQVVRYFSSKDVTKSWELTLGRLGGLSTRIWGQSC